MRGSEPARGVQLVLPHIHGDNHRGAKGPGELNEVGSHPARGHDGDTLSRPQLRLVADRAIGGHERTADDARFLQGEAVGQREHVGGRHHRVVGQAPHAVHRQGGPIGAAQAAGAVVELSAQAVDREERDAEIVTPLDAELAGAARHDKTAHHPRSVAEAGDAGPHRGHRPGDLMPQHRGSGKRDFTFDDVEVGVADSAGGHPHEHFARLGYGGGDVFDLQGGVHPREHDGAHTPRPALQAA